MLRPLSAVVAGIAYLVQDEVCTWFVKADPIFTSVGIVHEHGDGMVGKAVIATCTRCPSWVVDRVVRAQEDPVLGKNMRIIPPWLLAQQPWSATPSPNPERPDLSRFVGAAVTYATNYLIASFPSYTVRHAWYRRLLGWYIGPGSNILLGQRVQIQSLRTNGKRVSIGADTRIDAGCLLSTEGGLLIGDHVYISPGVWLITGGYDINDPNFQSSDQPIVIDNYAWIGPRAIIQGGITIGEGAVVLSGAVVMHDVEPYCIVSGVPAQVVGARELRNPTYSLPRRPPLG